MEAWFDHGTTFLFVEPRNKVNRLYIIRPLQNSFLIFLVILTSYTTHEKCLQGWKVVGEGVSILGSNCLYAYTTIRTAYPTRSNIGLVFFSGPLHPINII